MITKSKLRRNTCLAAWLLACLLWADAAFATVLNVQQYYQEKDQWCWAATSQAILEYYGTVKTQTQIAQYGTPGSPDTWNYIYGSDSTHNGVDLILMHFAGLSSTPYGISLTEADLTTQINLSRPVAIRWAWDTGGGHILAVKGIAGDTVYLMDPWNGDTEISTYSWVVRSASDGHTWTDSLTMDTSPLQQQTGSLTVAISPQNAITAGAKWNVDGGALQNSGATVPNLTVGQHTVAFNNITGWNTPANQTVTIANGQTTTASETYVQQQQTGSLTVTIGPQAAIDAGAKWNVDGGPWQSSGATSPNLTVGQHTVAFNNITGWNTPANQTTNITNGQTRSLTGIYIQQAGSVAVTISPAAAVSAGAAWCVDGGSWQGSGTTVSGLTIGQHTVALKDITGWVKAANQTVQITSGRIASLSGQYNQLPAVSSFKIAGNAASTINPTVKLNNTATGTPTLYMASESPDFSVASWSTYSTAPNFTLSTGSGLKTVYFKVKNSAGESVVVSDSITYTAKPTLSSFKINSDDASTASLTVTLNNSATESPTQYMASQSPTFVNATWRPYSASPSFALKGGNGTKTVYFKVRNSAGVSSVLSDTITLAQLPTVTSLKINGGAASTITQVVKFNNTTTVAPTQFMASEDPNFNGASWRSYSTAPTFTLSAGSGIKTVYFKVMNSAGESTAASDTIQLIVRPTVTSFQINNPGDTATSSPTVTLSNTATESPTYYMASQSSSFSGAAWKAYSAAPAFNLSAGKGVKTVYFKVKNSAGASNIMNAAITLN